MPSALNLLLLFLAFDWVLAQFSNWAEHQINTTICTWSNLRAALIRDTVYLDGGSLWWLPGLDDGTFGGVVNQGNFEGIILTYNLSVPLMPESNVTGLLLKDSISKARGGSGNNNGLSSNYVGGALLANDAEFFMYGGRTLEIEHTSSSPGADSILGYQAYQYGPPKPLWRNGFVDVRLSEGVTRYITDGGAASAPSENKAWYFSGLTSSSRGPIYLSTGSSASATNVSDTLITLDMTTQYQETWTNKTLPDYIKGRANAEIVWVPIGKDGILVVLGGVVYPEWAGNLTHESDNPEANRRQSPEFMKTIDIYDIANDKWYQQKTDNGPSARTEGCAVVAPAADESSFNIYYYGGFDGVDVQGEFYDDFWVLSLPSFTWTMLHSGTSSHSRAGHKCFLPYPDQMMIVGGYTPLSGYTLNCLENGPVVFFNVTSGEWMNEYNPAKYEAYGVPAAVQKTIGGTYTGEAALNSPVRSGWASKELEDTFASRYNKSKVTQYWPYQAVEVDNTPYVPPQKRHNKVPSWVPPVLGAVLGLVVFTGLLLIFCLFRRRLEPKYGFTSSLPTETASQIFRWIRGQPHRKAKELLSVSDQSSNSGLIRMQSADLTVSSTRPSEVHEMDDTQVVELGDTSPTAEMQDTFTVPVTAVQRRSTIAPLLTSFKSFSSLDSSIRKVFYPQSSISEATPTAEIPTARAIDSRNLNSAVSDESLRSARPALPPSGVVSPIVLDQESPILPESPPLEMHVSADYVSSKGGSSVRRSSCS